ncbi:MAG: hypothetical protein QMC67_16890 [Candidatus Wallbacteria bacterium]
MLRFRNILLSLGIASLVAGMFMLGGELLKEAFCVSALTCAPARTVGEILWNDRALDVICQGLIVFTGAFGVFMLAAHLKDDQVPQPAVARETEVNE